jgi:hypothetical protein
MRGVALAAGIPTNFTVEGTLGLAVFGLMLGLPFGALFAVLRGILPGPQLVRGLIFGLALLALFVVPPFLILAPEGEVNLAPPLVGFALFAPLPILYGLVLAAVCDRLAPAHGRVISRPVGIMWVAAFGAALLVALVGLASLPAAFRSPPLVSNFMRDMGLPFRIVVQSNQAFLLLFALAYCGLTIAIFWRGAASRPAKAVAVGLALFGTVFFQAAGLRHSTLIGPVLVTLLIGATVALFLLRRNAGPAGGRALRWPLIGVGACAALFTALWLLYSLTPTMRPTGTVGVSGLFVFPFFLLPWLFLPVSVALAMWRDGLFQPAAQE